MLPWLVDFLRYRKEYTVVCSYFTVYMYIFTLAVNP
jgi:hypothetical protein